MATLGDLKARIIEETTRDDLADDLAGGLTTVIRKAIETYEIERWWFNELLTQTVCTPGSAEVLIPVGTIRTDAIHAGIGGVRYRMTMRASGWIEDSYLLTAQGQPTDYAVFGPHYRLWPTPNAAYPLYLELIGEVQPPLDYADDLSLNAWTNTGADLIVAESKLRLYRDYLSATLQDTRIINANNQREEAYAKLRSETNRRISTGRIAPAW